MRRAIAVFALVLAGCDFGPGAETLRKDALAHLAEALPADTVELASFVRRGSQADTKAPAGETRRVIYYDVALKLKRDYNFGAWDSPGVAGLVSALGTGPKGLTGLSSEGNKAGDVIVAHATALYKREGKAWEPVVSGAYRPAAAPAYATGAAAGDKAALESLRAVMESVKPGGSPLEHAVISEELGAAQAAIRARLARLRDGYAIAAGPDQGQYLRLAQAVAVERTPRVIALVTRGGEENLRLLRDGKVSLALAQADAALDAYSGRGSFADEGPNPALRAIGSLYPEPVHVLVRAKSGYASVNDLKGRRVVIGVEGSASRTTALRVLEAHGLSARAIQPLELALGDALVALRQGSADAVIQVIGMPADSVRDAAAEIPLELLPLSERAIATLVSARNGYFEFTIPAGAYSSQKKAVRTIATAAVLVTSGGLSDSEVATITRFIFSKGRDFAAHGSAQGVQVSAVNARLGLSIPQHAAAMKALDAAPPAKPQAAKEPVK